MTDNKAMTMPMPIANHEDFLGRTAEEADMKMPLAARILKRKK